MIDHPQACFFLDGQSDHMGHQDDGHRGQGCFKDFLDEMKVAMA